MARSETAITSADNKVVMHFAIYGWRRRDECER